MDRAGSGISNEGSEDSGGLDTFVTLSRQDEALVTDAAMPRGVPHELFELTELESFYQEEEQALWTYMRPAGRPSFTPHMLSDFERWQDLIASGFGSGKTPLRYLILGSRAPGVFCFGGDLDLFQRLIRDRDRDGLVRYGHRCCKILHRNMNTLDIPMLTIGLVEGAALGGGFEALLSFDHIIAERDATFGLPEVMFGLFPGMGAHAFLSRKLGSAMADRLIISNETFSAEQMYDMGIVHQLAEKGEALSSCKEFIRKSERRHAGLVGARRATKISWALELEELTRITELWADTALQLREQDLRVMNRLTSAQQRLADAA
uniref:crotonase/enoyl-CoA hydratase family protein n=1 Tax=Parerythrobacter lutipelagi TaxID=1964208 RepID=UPI001F017697|nr:crotonase/enoyl-CoA hydratase family protein [Parerythrobacter lutipelagi]